MTPQQFVTKWQAVKLSERSACQQHFLDLCELLGQPKLATADPEGAWYCFERGATKTDGGEGWEDVYSGPRRIAQPAHWAIPPCYTDPGGPHLPWH